MMNINEYLDNINETKGFDAYQETDWNLWDMYCDEESDAFKNYCEEHEIDLTAETESIGGTELELNFWVWDHEE